MNLNNWLCKHFDKEKNGYVTIGDVFFGIVQSVYFVISLVGIYVFFFGGLVLAEMQGMVEGEQITTLSGLIVALLNAWFMPLITIGIILLGCALLYCISQLKIAKCPLKEDDK